MTKWKPPDPNQDLQGEKDPIYAIVLAWEREKKKIDPVYLGILLV